MAQAKPIYRTDGEWMAVLYDNHLFDTMGEWIAWLDGGKVYSLDGEYMGYISADGRVLRARVMPHHKRRRPPTVRPTYKHPVTVPLPPMFAELAYGTVDVFEEEPAIFKLITELRPDSGESSLPRLVDTDPEIAVQHRLRMVEQNMLEEMAYGMVFSYGIEAPPVPVEAMVAGVQPEDAAGVELARPDERWRMALALIDRLGGSEWAIERGYCGPEGFSSAQIEYASRALLVPRNWILAFTEESRHPLALAHRFLVSEEIVVLRLHDLELT